MKAKIFKKIGFTLLTFILIIFSLELLCIDEEENKTIRSLKQTIETNKPDYIVIGNSVVMDAIDLINIESETQSKLVSFARAGKNSAYWYLLVKNVISAAQHKPRAVLLTFNTHGLTSAKSKVTGRYRKDIYQMALGFDHVLHKKAYDSSALEYLRHWSTLFRNREKYKAMIDSEIQRFIRALLGLKLWQVKLFQSRVFAPEEMIPLLYQESVHVDNQSRKELYDFESQVEHSFLPDILNLLTDKGIRPVAVNLKTNLPLDERHLQYFSKLKQYLFKMNAEYKDFSSLEGFQEDDFVDSVHMSSKGRSKFTEKFLQFIHNDFNEPLKGSK